MDSRKVNRAELSDLAHSSGEVMDTDIVSQEVPKFVDASASVDGADVAGVHEEITQGAYITEARRKVSEVFETVISEPAMAASASSVATNVVGNPHEGELESSISTSPEAVKSKVTVRKARVEDMGRLAELDILLFVGAYGQTPPPKEEMQETLTERFMNMPDWMFVAEMNGQVEGFVSAFPTNVPVEDFVSWENSTADGTLRGKVDHNGKYVYVTNMTIKHEAVENGAEDMLLANLFANAIWRGSDYGYFVARMPKFKEWLSELGISVDVDDFSQDELSQLAVQYADMRDDEGKRIDKQLKMYEGLGYSLLRVMPNAFQDDASMNFGVVCRAWIPPKNEIAKGLKPVRMLMSGALRYIAKYPKLLRKLPL